MKLKIITLLFAATFFSNAASTLTISGVSGAGTGVLTNLASSTGDVTSKKVWGILIDSEGNGITAGQYIGGVSLTGGATTRLSVASGFTDDYVVISSNLMVNTNSATLDGGSVASGTLARPTQLAGLNYTATISSSDRFYIIWFDDIALGGTADATEKYGIYSNPGLVLPPDGTTNQSFATLFTGAEGTVITANNTFLAAVPETSTSLLGALGALALLRRRRN